ncbi:AraC family transcriptional regulator [Alteromonadaceae bacterium 2753L.S.0a.02]|nr:AraC family transcriptional regulator [Alteromonadaceae bacterium 2753L.S.0a.02]
MNTLQLSFYAMAVALCAFTGLLAWRATSGSRYFLLFLSLLVVMFACDWLMHHPDTPLKNLWLLVLMASTLLVSPCCLLLAKSVGHSELRVPWRRHSLLVALAWLLLIPLATAIHWGTGFVNTVQPISRGYALFIHSTMLLAIAVFLLQTGWVLTTSCAFLRRRSQQNTWLFSVLEDPGLNTLRMLVLSIITNTLVALARVLYCALLDETHMSLNLGISAVQLFMVMFLAVSYIAQVVNANSQNEALRDALFHNQQQIAPRGEPGRQPSAAKPGLAAECVQSILKKLRVAMDVEHLYKRPGLSLRELCDHLGESPHHVSEVINNSELRNFYDMVNRRRVALASSLLEQNPQASVLDIAFDCGFNSKSSFNSVFKRYRGTTPSQYRARVQSINLAADV